MKVDILDFKRYDDPEKALRVGKMGKIMNWLETNTNLTEDTYEIDKDSSITVYDDLNLLKLGLNKLPNFINFKKVYGNVWAAGNNWESLQGFPNEIIQDFQFSSISLHTQKYKFSEEYIKKIITVHGKIWC